MPCYRRASNFKIKSLPQENEYNTEYTMLYYNSRQDFSFVVSTKLKLLPVILKTSFESVLIYITSLKIGKKVNLLCSMV